MSEVKIRGCTCYPDEGRPFPCPQKFAESECKEADAYLRGRIAGLREAAEIAKSNATEAWKDGAAETKGLMRLQAEDIANSIINRADALERGEE